MSTPKEVEQLTAAGANKAVNPPGFATHNQHQMSPVAWRPARILNLDEWLYQGARLGSIGRGAGWWIGDWVNYGNAKFGEKYSRAAQVTGYDIQSLMNMAYVASRLEIPRRRPNLSWSHHAEVAPLTVDEQERWLWTAIDQGLSVRRLREELRKRRERSSPPRQLAKKSDYSAAYADTSSTAQDQRSAPEPTSAVCPRCGYELGHPG